MAIWGFNAASAWLEFEMRCEVGTEGKVRAGRYEAEGLRWEFRGEGGRSKLEDGTMDDGR